MQNRDFQIWTHDVTSSNPEPVYPDGCRDVVILHRADRPTLARLTPFDLRPRLAVFPVGIQLQGYRLRPGAQISDASLRAIAKKPDRATDIIRNDFALSDDVSLAIHALCIAHAVTAEVARDLGVS
jgi:hypothetical protein